MVKVRQLRDEHSCYFGVYNLKLVIQNSRLIERKFIVLKKDKNTIIKFTKLHKYLSVGKRKTSIRIDSTSGKKIYYVCKMLNYLFITHSHVYKLRNVNDITTEHLHHFMFDYAMNRDDELSYPTEATVTQCVNAVIDFVENYLDDNNYIRGKDQIFTKVITSRNKYKKIVQKNVPTFKVYNNGSVKNIFRDMPNSAFNLIMSYAATHYRHIFFLMSLSAYAGMRPSEACNVRRENSPLGKGIYIYKEGKSIKKIKCDLREEKLLRSDLVPVGGIKKERMQKVYPKFIDAFLRAYELHQEFLSDQKYEVDYGPMSINKNGMAITYNTYYTNFREMIDEMKPLFLNHSNPEISTFGHMLLEHNIGPHIFRHWFSVRLTLYGEDVANLQYWRGDNSPKSAITYLQNKGELSKQLAHVNNVMFDFMENSAKEII